MADAKYTCVECGCELSGRQRKYCTDQCKWKYVGRAHLAKRAARYRAKIPQRTCAECGSAFLTWETKRKKYCSQKCEDVVARRRLESCRTAYRAVERSREQAVRADVARYTRLDVCACGRLKRHARSRCTLCAKKASIKVYSCQVCGVQYSAIPGAWLHDICSDECRRQLKRLQGSGKHRLRARRHGVKYVSFKPTDILERDRWHCRICGVHTPERLRGSSDARAPTLGHIVALARGGQHTPENTQCECWACNMRKRTKALGQMILPGMGSLPKGKGVFGKSLPLTGNRAHATVTLKRSLPLG